MSHRFNILVSEQLDARVSREAQRSRMSKGDWVRRVLSTAVERPVVGSAVERLAQLGTPAANIEQMLEEIQVRRG